MIFLLKIPWNRSTISCNRSMWLTGVVHGFIKPGPSTRWSMTQIKNAKGYPLDLISAVGYTWMATGTSPSSVSSGQSGAPGCHGCWLERAQAWATVHHLRQGFFLRDLCDKSNPICPLTMVETTEGKPTTRERLGRPSMVVGTTSGGALAPRTPPTAVV
jgi:hypothetical protein